MLPRWWWLWLFDDVHEQQQQQQREAGGRGATRETTAATAERRAEERKIDHVITRALLRLQATLIVTRSQSFIVSSRFSAGECGMSCCSRALGGWRWPLRGRLLRDEDVELEHEFVGDERERVRRARVANQVEFLDGVAHVLRLVAVRGGRPDGGWQRR